MLKSGAEHLEQLRDVRSVYIGRELVCDVTAHPAFHNGARTVAAIYDMKAATENRDSLSSEDDGERFSVYFLRPRTGDDLLVRSQAHRRIADLSYGMIGRSPDHVSSFVTGMPVKPAVFGPYGGNISAYYRYMRDNDVYAAYAVVPPRPRTRVRPSMG